MKLLRRTTSVALSVGVAIGVLVASFQVVDGIFGNPGIVASLWSRLSSLLFHANLLGKYYSVYRDTLSRCPLGIAPVSAHGCTETTGRLEGWR